MAGRIRLLFLGSEPSETPRVRVGAEARDIKEALARAAPGRFDVLENHAVRLDALQRIVVDARPHIVHFAGHGAKTGELIFEDAEGRPRLANPDALAALFHLAGKHTRLVVLNACYSHEQAIAIADHVDVVVGMTAAIPVPTSLAFSGEFYAHLARGQSVGEAFDLAENHVRLLNLPDMHMLQIVPRIGVDRRQVFVTASAATGGATAEEPVRQAGSAGPLRALEPGELRIRSRYLKHRRSDLENQIAESIHHARFIDLGIADSPIATQLPLVYKNPDSTREFRTVDEAFRVYDRRLLLLGAPGSGKTVSLQHLALALLAEADVDPGAPIPLMVNLSKFRFVASPALPRANGGESADRSFESWLASELAERGVRVAVAERWVEEGRIAALLDGLDEVNDERRADLAALLNETFLKAHPDSVVVICSRIDEYRPVQERKSTRLHLSGAVTLQPLAPPEIAAYLDAAGASGLREALGRDESLNELAQTPLTLSMMTLAYGGTAASHIPSLSGVADRRHHLIESFVARMLQRKERRDRGIPFDDDKDKEVPEAEYRYQPARVNRHLSWLAVRLSLRMQTACSLRRFHGFLERSTAVQESRSTAWVMGLARLAVLAVAVSVAALSLAPASRSGVLGAAAIGIGSCGLCLPAFFVKWNREGFRALAITGQVFACLLWQLAVAASLLAMWKTATPMSLGFIVLAGEIAGAMAILGWVESSRKLWAITAGAIAGGAVGILATQLHVVTGASDTWVAACLVGGQLVGGFVFFSEEPVWGTAIMLVIALGVVTWLVALHAAALSAIGDPTWQLTLGLVCYSLIILQLCFERPIAAMLGLIALVGAGSVLGDHDLALLGGALWGIILLVLVLAARRSRALKRMLDAVQERLERSTDLWILTPVVRSLLGVLGMLPPRWRAFARYAGQALLLKPFSGEFQFSHLLLRDHFALRELIPRLQQAERGRRGDMIHALGLQGVAAIDTLTALIAEGRAEERAAAVRALGRIASPEIGEHLTRAFGDASPEVRSAVVRSLRHVDVRASLAILESAVHDGHSDVVKAVIDEVGPGKDRWPGLARTLIARIFAFGEQTRELVRHVAAMSDTRFARELRHALPPTARDIVRELLGDTRPRVRRLACGWMQHNLAVSDVASLADQLRMDDELAVREAALLALAASWDDRATSAIARALADPSDTIRRKAAEVLGRRRAEQAVELLIRAAQSREEFARDHAIQALGRLRVPRAVDWLLSILGDRRPSMRAAAASALAASGQVRVVARLLEALADRKATVRRAAAEALGELQDVRAVEPLLRALSDKDLLVRIGAATSLGALRAHRALEPLSEMMESRSAKLRLAAASGLGELGDPRALEALVRALSDPDADVRASAARSLGSLRDTRAVTALIEALHDETEIRNAAAESLSRLADRRALEPLLEDVLGSGKRGPDLLRAFSTDAVVPYLENHSVRLRMGAARTLAHASDPAALEPLLEALRDPDADVRRLAAMALGTIGIASALEPLVRALASQERSAVRRAAAEALGVLGDARASDPLVALLTDKSDDVRVAAIGSLCALGDLRGEEPALAVLTTWSYDDMNPTWDDAEGESALGWMLRGLSRLERTAPRSALRRCLTDEASTKRSEIVGALVYGRSERDRALLSRDHDGSAPWIDPREPISRERVEDCAEQLQLTSSEVRIRYEALAPIFALCLSWEPSDHAPIGGERASGGGEMAAQP